MALVYEVRAQHCTLYLLQNDCYNMQFWDEVDVTLFALACEVRSGFWVQGLEVRI